MEMNIAELKAREEIRQRENAYSAISKVHPSALSSIIVLVVILLAIAVFVFVAGLHKFW
jgi:low affinity Fe/Cu permease